jgi:protein-tyrosine phosphatase
MPSVLFVCTANQFRSPIAAACLLKQIEGETLDQKWRVESAGTWAENGLSAPGIALQVAASLGLDGLESHLTRQVEGDLLDQFDLVIVMEMGHKEAIRIEFPSASQRLYLLSEIVDGIPYDIPDPAHSGVDPVDVGYEIYKMIAQGKDKILQLAESLCRD